MQLNGFKLLIDDASDTISYIGYAAPNTAVTAAGWRIIKVLTTAGVTQYLSADGNHNFDNIWNNRASLVYS